VAPRIRKADAIFGSSNHITGLIQRRFPQYAHTCHTVYNGVDTALLVPNETEKESSAQATPRLLFVGRVSPEKGVHVLLDAFRIVAQRIPGVALDIVGPVGAMPKEILVGLSDDAVVAGLGQFYPGDYLENLKSRIPADLAAQVTFHGPLEQSQLLQYYQATDILINPSFSESFGMSLVEAMACERPVIATRVGGMQEIVQHGTTGLMVERNDAAALAEAIVQLLADREMRATMGKAGRKRAIELFAWRQVARNVLGHYESMIQQGISVTSAVLSG
jgi:glycosyltransferase involved in cell wall biosynthesis